MNTVKFLDKLSKIDSRFLQYRFFHGTATLFFCQKPPKKEYWSYFNKDYYTKKEDLSEIPPAEENELGENYRQLKIYPDKMEKEKDKSQITTDSFRVMPPRWTRMKPTQNWANVWPTAHSFKASAVPLPVRMGYIKKKHYLKRQPPEKHANLELMKIPNFLHLTPPAIKTHCEALKKFCSEWPEGVDTDEKRQKHFPLEMTYSDYIFAGPSVRDPRARIVTTQIKVSSLKLDQHAKWKFITLAGDRYDKNTDILTIVTDRCPVRHQNKDYAIYLLTALYHQSWKTEKWETEIDEVDRVQYFWEGTKSKKRVFAFLKAMIDAEKSDPQSQRPSYLKNLPENFTNQDLDNLPEIKAHTKTIEIFKEEGETFERIENYAKTMRILLGLPNLDVNRVTDNEKMVCQ